MQFVLAMHKQLSLKRPHVENTGSAAVCEKLKLHRNPCSVMACPRTHGLLINLHQYWPQLPDNFQD